MDEKSGFDGLVTPQKNKDDIESLRDEIEQIRTDILGGIEANEADINAIEQALAGKADVTALPASKRDRVVHWVQEPFIALGTELKCKEILSTDLAGEVFNDYLVNREDVMPVGVGDILALNCNISRRAERGEFDGERYHVEHYSAIYRENELRQPLLDEESSGSGGSGDEGEEEEEEIIDKIEGCTYLGLVLGTDGLFQDESPEFTDNDGQVTNEVLNRDFTQRIQRVYEKKEGGGDRKILYEILVWSTCTNSGGGVDDCPENPEGVRIKELIPPESGSSDVAEYLTLYDPTTEDSEGEVNMVLSRLKSLAEGDGSDTESTKFIGVKINPNGDEEGNFETLTHLEQKRGNTAIGLRPDFVFQDIQIKPKSVEAELEEVSLQSTPLELQSRQFDKKSLEIKDVSIFSDKCGKLGLDKELSDGESETFDLLAKSNDYVQSSVSLYKHTFKKKESDGDDEPLTIADLSKVSVYQKEPTISPEMLSRKVWWPLIPFGQTFLSGDELPAESSDGTGFQTVKDMTFTMSSSIVSLATGEDYGKQVRQIHLQIAKEKMVNQFYSGLWCGSDIPPSGEQPEYIDLYANIPISEVSLGGTEGFTGDLFSTDSHQINLLSSVDNEDGSTSITYKYEYEETVHDVKNGLVKDSEDGPILRGNNFTVNIPAVSLGDVSLGTSFTDTINLANQFWVGSYEDDGTVLTTPTINDALPADHQFALDSEHLYFRIPVGLASYRRQLDVKNGLIEDLNTDDFNAETFEKSGDISFRIPKVSLGVTQGITDTINSPTLGGVTVTKTANASTGGETVTIQANHANNFYEVENGLIKEVSNPATTISNTDVSFEIPPAGGGSVSGATQGLKVIRADATPSITVADKAGDATKTQVQIRLATNSLEVENGLVKTVTASDGSEDELLISFDIPKSTVSGFTEKTMLVCDEDGNSRVITVLAKE